MIFSTAASNPTYDIVIYGATSAGVTAGIQATRMGKSVVVLEPGEHIGGLTTGGLGQTDIGNKQIVGGISREFYQGIRAWYADETNWIWQASDTYQDGGQTKTDPNEDAMWTFEPSAARKVMQSMIDAAGLEIRVNQRLLRDGSGVAKDGTRLVSIQTEDGTRYEAKVFIDATYEGDLLAEAGVSFAVGRESNDAYRETLNGVQFADWAPTLRGVQAGITKEQLQSIQSPQDPLFQNGLVSMNAASHQLAGGVDPYIEAGNPESGLLPGIESKLIAPDGTGDAGVQAYNYRITLTDHPENRIRIEQPEGYDPLNYELMLRHFEALEKDWPSVWIPSAMPNRKTDSNNNGGFSTDWIGQNHRWPEMSYEERGEWAQALRDYTLGFLWTLQNSDRVPEPLRNYASELGLPRDEFPNTGHFTPQVYVREGRRMIGEMVVTQHHCERLKLEEDVIGMAAYGMDSHHVQRYVTENGYARNEGNVQGHVTEPYPISYRALTPNRDEATNLIVPVAVSSTHIAFGSIRMEPVFMLLGQSAATAAALAIDADSAVQDVAYPELRSQLLKDKQRLE